MARSFQDELASAIEAVQAAFSRGDSTNRAALDPIMEALKALMARQPMNS